MIGRGVAHRDAQPFVGGKFEGKREAADGLAIARHGIERDRGIDRAEVGELAGGKIIELDKIGRLHSAMDEAGVRRRREVEQAEEI